MDWTVRRHPAGQAEWQPARVLGCWLAGPPARKYLEWQKGPGSTTRGLLANLQTGVPVHVMYLGCTFSPGPPAAAHERSLPPLLFPKAQANGLHGLPGQVGNCLVPTADIKDSLVEVNGEHWKLEGDDRQLL